MQCSNNLKQLALAYHNYHDTNNQFPAGNIATNALSNGANNRSGTAELNGGFYDGMWGWPVAILPYLEGGNLATQFDHELATLCVRTGRHLVQHVWPRDDARPAKRRPLPADAQDVLLPLHATRRPGGGRGQFKNYAINAGGGVNISCLLSRTGARQRRHRPQEQQGPHGGSHRRHQQHVSAPRAGQHLQRARPSARHAGSRPAHQSLRLGQPPFAGHGHRRRRHRPTDAAQPHPAAHAGLGANGRTVWGYHPSGVQASMCDGSVHFIPNTIAQVTWQGAFTRNGGEVVTLPVTNRRRCAGRMSNA